MKILEFYRNRKYFIRLLLSISLVVAAFLVAFCSILYVYLKNDFVRLHVQMPIGTVSFLLLACFLLLSIPVSLMISIKLYQPVGSLMQSIQCIEKEYDSIARSCFLRRLVMESETISPQEFADAIEQHRLSLSGNSFALIILKIAGYKKLPNQAKGSEQRLYQFAMANIAKEIIASKAANETVTIGGDCLAIVVSLDCAASPSAYAELPSMVRAIQETVYRYYNISLSASISREVHQAQDISKACDEANSQSAYLIVYGKTAVITPELVAENERNEDFHLPIHMERKWAETIKSGSLQDIEAQLIELFARMATYRHDRLLSSIQYLADFTVRTVQEICLGPVKSAKGDEIDFTRRLLEKEALDEIAMLFVEFMRDFSEQRGTMRENKTKLLIDATKEAIEVQYADPSLNLQSIASALRMNAMYIGKMFKLQEGVSVTDYINAVRIGRAMELLRYSELTISQIMNDVGCVSESHFYKVFKKSTGLTPKEFRTNHIVTQVIFGEAAAGRSRQGHSGNEETHQCLEEHEEIIMTV